MRTALNISNLPVCVLLIKFQNSEVQRPRSYLVSKLQVKKSTYSRCLIFMLYLIIWHLLLTSSIHIVLGLALRNIYLWYVQQDIEHADAQTRSLYSKFLGITNLVWYVINSADHDTHIKYCARPNINFFKIWRATNYVNRHTQTRSQGTIRTSHTRQNAVDQTPGTHTYERPDPFQRLRVHMYYILNLVRTYHHAMSTVPKLFDAYL